MSNEPQVIEQAQPLAPPDEASPTYEGLDEIQVWEGGEPLQPEKKEPEPAAEQPAPASEDEPNESEQVEAAEASDDELLEQLAQEPEKPKRPSGSARLKAQVAELQAEVDRLRQSVPQVSDAEGLEAAIVREIGPPPRESDFSDYLAFTKAETAYETAKMLVSRELKKASEATKAAIERQQRAEIELFQERVDAFRAKAADFDEVLRAATTVPTNGEVIAAIRESEKGPAIAYYLAKNPSIVQNLNSMSLRDALKTIGSLETRLSPAPQKQTKAPAPVPAVKGASSPPKEPTAEEIESWPQHKFNKWMNDRMKSRG